MLCFLRVSGSSDIIHSGHVSIFVGHVGNGLKAAVGQGNEVFSGGRVPVTAFLVAKVVVVVVLHGIFPVVVGFNL